MKRSYLALGLVVLLLIGGGVFAWVWSMGEHQKRALKAANEMGAIVQVQDTIPGKPVTVTFRKGTLSPEQVARLHDIANLTTVNLIDTQVGDEAAPALAQLSGLRSLDLSGTQITDAGLKPLHGLTALSFRNTAVSDAGLTAVANFAELRSLNAAGTKITDAGMKKLSQKFRVLNLDDTPVGDA